MHKGQKMFKWKQWIIKYVLETPHIVFQWKSHCRFQIQTIKYMHSRPEEIKAKIMKKAMNWYIHQTITKDNIESIILKEKMGCKWCQKQPKEKEIRHQELRAGQDCVSMICTIRKLWPAIKIYILQILNNQTMMIIWK